MSQARIPEVSSSELGELGVPHLKRYWRKKRMEVEGGLDRGVVAAEYDLDFTLVQGLGLGIVEPADFIFHNRPSFDEFERWIVHTLGGRPSPTLVARLSDMVSRYLNEAHRVYPVANATIDAPVLTAEDLAFWDTNGYVVLRGAVPREDCRAAERVIWEHLGMDPDKPDTWYNGQHAFWVSLFQHPALNRNRASPRIHKAFAQLWGTEDLWATVDRSSLNRPQRGDMDISGPSRLHWDVSLGMPMPLGIQGLLYLNDVSAEQGAFRCVPGFQHRLESWLAALPPDANPREQDLESLGPVPIAGQAGDFVLWHHALPHGSGRNRAHYPRVVQYISLFPHDYGIHPEWR